jgi:hypothetical protein
VLTTLTDSENDGSFLMLPVAMAYRNLIGNGKLFLLVYVRIPKHLRAEINQDTVAEWLRRRTRNPLGSARAGSNPAGVDKIFLHFFRA